MTPRKAFWIKWMNRTRYKDDKGKLVIHTTPQETDETKARQNFASYTRMGYACKLVMAELKQIEAIDFAHPDKLRYVDLKTNEQVLEENDRWKLRMKEREIQNLSGRKDRLEKELKSVTDQLKKLKEE